MNPLFWLDDQILKFFNKIVKHANWHLGVGQFFMARFVLALALIVGLIDIIYFSKYLYLALAIFFLGGAMAVSFQLTIESDLVEEQLKEAKSLPRSNFLKAMRFLFILASLILSRSMHFHQVIFYTIWVYFLSVDFPPFRKSESTEPQLAPIPIPRD